MKGVMVPVGSYLIGPTGTTLPRIIAVGIPNGMVQVVVLSATAKDSF